MFLLWPIRLGLARGLPRFCDAQGVRVTPYDFIWPFEGKIPHMYLDTAGFVTTGVGFMLPDLAAARRLSWDRPGFVDTDWASVRAQPLGRPAASYRRFTNARLTEDVIKREFETRLALFESQMVKALPAWRSYPDSVRIALLDMAYNMGGGFLAHWPKLHAAVKARAWHECARQCVRTGPGAQPARNAATVALFATADL